MGSEMTAAAFGNIGEVNWPSILTAAKKLGMSAGVEDSTRVVVCSNCQTKNRVPASAHGVPRRGKRVEPALHDCDLTTLQLCGHIAVENLNREVEVISGNRMTEGLFCEVLRQIPASRSAMVSMAASGSSSR